MLVPEDISPMLSVETGGVVGSILETFAGEGISGTKEYCTSGIRRLEPSSTSLILSKVFSRERTFLFEQAEMKKKYTTLNRKLPLSEALQYNFPFTDYE